MRKYFCAMTPGILKSLPPAIAVAVDTAATRARFSVMVVSEGQEEEDSQVQEGRAPKQCGHTHPKIGRLSSSSRSTIDHAPARRRASSKTRAGAQTNDTTPSDERCTDVAATERRKAANHRNSSQDRTRKHRSENVTVAVTVGKSESSQPCNGSNRAQPNRNPNRTPFHHVTGLQHVEGSSNSRYQVVLAKDPSYFPKTQPGPFTLSPNPSTL